MSGIRRACGPAGCVPSETLVDAPGGPRPVASVEVGDLVFGADGERARVRAVLVRRHAGPMVVLHLAEAGVRRLTAEHPVRVLEGAPAWRPAGDLAAGAVLEVWSGSRAEGRRLLAASTEPFDGLVFDLDVEPGSTWRSGGLSLHSCARVRAHLPGIPGVPAR